MIRDFHDCTKKVMKEMEKEIDSETKLEKPYANYVSTFMDPIFLSENNFKNISAVSGGRYLLGFSSITY